MTHITEAVREIVELNLPLKGKGKKIKDKVANSDVMRKMEGKLSKADSAIRLGRNGIEFAIHRIDMVAELSKRDGIDKKAMNDLLLKSRRSLVKDLVAIKNFEKMMK